LYPSSWQVRSGLSIQYLVVALQWASLPTTLQAAILDRSQDPALRKITGLGKHLTGWARRLGHPFAGLSSPLAVSDLAPGGCCCPPTWAVRRLGMLLIYSRKSYEMEEAVLHYSENHQQERLIEAARQSPTA
jgi:hypothetical protein